MLKFLGQQGDFIESTILLNVEWNRKGAPVKKAMQLNFVRFG